MLLLGLLENAGNLVGKRPYEVALIEKLGDDIFAVYDKGTVFRILQIPRGCHEPFRKFCIKLKETRVENVYLELAGRTDDGNPSLRYMAAGFTCICAKNPPPCARVGVCKYICKT